MEKKHAEDIKLTKLVLDWKHFFEIIASSCIANGYVSIIYMYCNKIAAFASI
jgi:hypothetical protein